VRGRPTQLGSRIVAPIQKHGHIQIFPLGLSLDRLQQVLFHLPEIYKRRPTTQRQLFWGVRRCAKGYCKPLTRIRVSQLILQRMIEKLLYQAYAGPQLFGCLRDFAVDTATLPLMRRRVLS